jgi:hypothetical protein
MDEDADWPRYFLSRNARSSDMGTRLKQTRVMKSLARMRRYANLSRMRVRSPAGTGCAAS